MAEDDMNELAELNAVDLADRLVKDLIERDLNSTTPALNKSAVGHFLLKQSQELQRDVAVALIHRLQKGCKKSSGFELSKEEQEVHTASATLRALLRRNLPFCDADVLNFFKWLNSLHIHSLWGFAARATTTLERFVDDESPSEQLIEVASLVGDKFSEIGGGELRKCSNRIAKALGEGAIVPLNEGDVWANKAIRDIQQLPSECIAAWNKLLLHCQTATASKPSAKWSASALALIENEITFDVLFVFLQEWFVLVDKPAAQETREGMDTWYRESEPYILIGINQDALKGLVWCCSLRFDSGIIRALSNLCISAFKKIPGIGPRATGLGNACIYVLGTSEGADALAQLALLKVKIRNRGTQNQIAKALQIAADREGVTTDELEEMSVPEYGLTDIGVLEEAMGDFTARLSIVGSNSTKLEWLKVDGKVQKSVPAAVKNDYSGELKELRSTAKDIQKMLPAIRERIDNFYLQQRSWAYSVWCERYLNHPLVGFFARRLIWLFENKGETFTVFFHAGKWVDHHGNEVEALSENAKNFSVRLWHPLDEDTSEVLAWRNWIEEQLIQQPFKQAHREIYLLTAAEENTNTYSNRYAAHIIKQHQFNALCQARGWRNSLRLMVDDEYPPASKSLERWGMRAEFWIEGVGDDYGTDTTESGSYLYLATDQVRFYPIGTALSTAHAGGGGYGPGWRGEVGDPLPLADVPKLVFSEIMRDVDLFIGVSSVGNDPAWADGGPNGHHRDYWYSYSFGELSGTAKSRKEILERLLPRLKIAKKSHIDGKFLVVEGSKHAYKIHLGSGNILMSPSDQYLCIVPNASQRKGSDKLFLPFEGDKVLAIILSKAFMLAEDHKIKDATILAQIGG